MNSDHFNRPLSRAEYQLYTDLYLAQGKPPLDAFILSVQASCPSKDLHIREKITLWSTTTLDEATS